MYNAKGYLVENPSNRYILRPDSAVLRKNSDGSVTLYLQADEPARDRAANWLPTPRGIFIVTLRTYLPQTEISTGACSRPPSRG